MQIRSISAKKIESMAKIVLSKDIFNTEARLYRYNEKENEKVAKIFYNTDGDGFGNKLLTLNSLVDLKDYINMDELVMPEKLISSNGEIVGYTMDYIDNINLKDVVNNLKYDDKLIFDYFKQIGEIFEKIEKINAKGELTAFYLNDVHESNFIIEKNTNKVKVVDIDSCRISDNAPFASRYLTPFSKVAHLPYKYHVCENSRALGYIEPNMDSELYCYNIMILNYLYHGDVQKMEIPDFYNYLNYLENLNFPHNLLDSFSRLYNYNENINPKDMLDEIPKTFYKAHKNAYNIVK